MSEGDALIADAGTLPAGTQGRLAVKGLGLDVQFTIVEADPAGLRIRFTNAEGDHDRIHAALAGYEGCRIGAKRGVSGYVPKLGQLFGGLTLGMPDVYTHTLLRVSPPSVMCCPLRSQRFLSRCSE